MVVTTIRAFSVTLMWPQSRVYHFKLIDAPSPILWYSIAFATVWLVLLFRVRSPFIKWLFILQHGQRGGDAGRNQRHLSRIPMQIRSCYVWIFMSFLKQNTCWSMLIDTFVAYSESRVREISEITAFVWLCVVIHQQPCFEVLILFALFILQWLTGNRICGLAKCLT